jgi:hypothetical protein
MNGFPIFGFSQLLFLIFAQSAKCCKKKKETS